MENDHVMDATVLRDDAGLSEPRISRMGGMGCDVGWVLGAGGEVLKSVGIEVDPRNQELCRMPFVRLRVECEPGI